MDWGCPIVDGEERRLSPRLATHRDNAPALSGSSPPALHAHSRSLIALVVGVLISTPVVTEAAPLAQILTPAPGTKLRKGNSAGVAIRARGSAGLAWTLSLNGPASTSILATGENAVDAQVALLDDSVLIPGDLYELRLVVAEGDLNAIATSSVIVPDPHFRVIPMRDGSSTLAYDTYTVDGSGDRTLYSPRTGSPAPLTIIHRGRSERETILADLGSSSGVKFSGDGSRLFFRGRFTSRGSIGLGFLDLGSETGKLISSTAISVFNADHTGHRMVYEGGTRGPGTRSIYQYFLYDEERDEKLQLTNDPETIDHLGNCPSQSGSTPLISADGSKIVFLSSATLGLAPADPDVGCRVFEYDVASQQMRQVVTLPSAWREAHYPSLSSDGRWLSFPIVETFPTGGNRGIPVLVDMETSEIEAPVIDTGRFTNFDSSVTADGNALIISSQADLDPRVGNADHNLELFHLDRATGDIRQITETVGGIGTRPGGCPNYDVSVSSDGTVLAFSTSKFDSESCRLDGPQRSAENGMWLGMVRAVRKRPGNHSVVMQGVESQRVVASEELSIVFRATDEDGDPISFYAQVPGTLSPPQDATFDDHHDGTATLQWATRPEHAGTHVIRIAAFDEGGGEALQDVNITVVAAGDEEIPCAGACTDPDMVSVEDLVTLVNIAMGSSSSAVCSRGDVDSDGSITVEEILTALENLLNGCNPLTKGSAA